jgi:hypothetical protein
VTVLTPPLFVSVGGETPDHARLAYMSLLTGALGAFAGGIGAVDAAHGIVRSGDLEVTEKAGTPGMSVDVAAGAAWIRGTENDHQGAYHLYNDDVVNLAISNGDPSNGRNDLICGQIRDEFYGSAGTTDARLVVIEGTPAATPTDPTVPDNCVVLARVNVDANESTSILAADIDDLRTVAGGWRDVVTNLVNVSEGNGTFTGRYQQTGQTVRYAGSFVIGSTTSIVGSVSLDLPVPKHANWSGTLGSIQLSDTGTKNYPGVVTSGGVLIHSHDTGSGLVSATVPFTWTTGDYIAWNLTYEAA